MRSLVWGAGYLLLSIVVISLDFQPQAANDHIALVIGNSHYSYTSSLPNTIHDAEDIASALGNVGFDVILKRDSTRDELQTGLDQLSAKIPNSKEVIFYYSGHAFQSEGKNYLAPVDIHVTRSSGIEQEAISLDRVLQALGSPWAKDSSARCLSHKSVRRIRSPRTITPISQLSRCTHWFLDRTQQCRR
jgi:hypothetical protein